MANDLLKSILDDEFLETLAKSADLYKIGSNSVLDPEEIRIGLKVVPRAVMSMLISELTPMQINSHKDIKLPFGDSAYMSANKNAADDYTGSVYSGNKLVYDFKNRSIPGLGIILLSTFELYDLEKLSESQNSAIENSEEKEDSDKKIQKLIDERMELHSLVSRVVEDKIMHREALHRLMMAKLNDALKSSPVQKASEEQFTAIKPPIMSPPGPQMRGDEKPIEVTAKDVIKKESAPKKGSPLKQFLERKKKPKSKEYQIEVAKSEQINCPDCAQPIFGGAFGFSPCICYGPDQNRKVWIKKNEDGVSIRFSKSWSPENIEMLLDMLRKRR
jgi:hypothetical protein